MNVFTWRGEVIANPRQWAKDRGDEWVTWEEFSRYPNVFSGGITEEVRLMEGPSSFFDHLRMDVQTQVRNVKREPA